MNAYFTIDQIGYFDDENQVDPAYNPKIEDSVCPFCSLQLSHPMKTISFLKEESRKSFFYRAHKKCYEDREPGVEDFIVELSL